MFAVVPFSLCLHDGLNIALWDLKASAVVFLLNPDFKLLHNLTLNMSTVFLGLSDAVFVTNVL